MAGSQASNSQAEQFQEQQAAQAQQKEQLRQQHLNQGMDAINRVFDGSPVMGTKTEAYDWSQFNPTAMTPAVDPITGQTTMTQGAGVPAGYSAVQVPKKAAPGAAAGDTWTFGGQTFARPAPTSTGPDAFSMGGGDGTSGADTTWALKNNATGETTQQGDPLSITSTYDTGKKTGGFDDAYYEKYRQDYLNLYQPDEARQYNEAQRDLGYNLARSGLTRSSAAADKQGELSYNDQLQTAKIVGDASNAENDLRTTVQNEKQSVINQLYSTEDPTLAANLAQSGASAINLRTPTMTPGAQLFGPALTAVASGVANYASPYQPVAPNAAYPQGGQAPGTVASASSSTGRAYS
jgi:hypothetical protein